jgi:hypothetical protein
MRISCFLKQCCLLHQNQQGKHMWAINTEMD